MYEAGMMLLILMTGAALTSLIALVIVFNILRSIVRGIGTLITNLFWNRKLK